MWVHLGSARNLDWIAVLPLVGKNDGGSVLAADDIDFISTETQMKIKLQELANAQHAMSVLGNLKLDPASKVSYKVSKGMRLMFQEMRALEATRIGLLKIHGKLNVAGNNYDMTPEARDEFDAALKIYTDRDVDLPFLLVTRAELAGLPIESNVLAALTGIVIEDGESGLAANDPVAPEAGVAQQVTAPDNVVALTRKAPCPCEHSGADSGPAVA